MSDNSPSQEFLGILADFKSRGEIDGILANL